MGRVNVWLKSETGELLERARARHLQISKNTRVTNDDVIRAALEAYIHDRKRDA